MGFECGIVGLPNVGKSTLFNALTATAAAEAANYPFTTVEPNTGVVAVPDERLERVAALAGSPRATPTTLRFVDIAGLVRGASRGEGLGNRFLAQIREVDAICHVVRCFDDGGVAHIEGAIDPIRDAETVDTELMLADLESLERRVEAATKRARGGDAEAKEQLAVMQPALAVLGDGRPARAAAVPEHRREAFRALQLLTAKPVLYVCNVAEAEAATGNAWSEAIARRAAAEGAGAVVISVEIEAEVAQLDDAAERQEYLAALGLAETGLARLIRAGYALLDLITFFSAGPKEARAWTVTRGTKAAQAAGQIHTDFERGFIAAETTAGCTLKAATTWSATAT
jgi:GTP-binding protein YchF